MNLRLAMLPIVRMTNSLPQQGLMYEVGCGAGALAKILSENNPKRNIIGIDLDHQKIRVAQKIKSKNCTYIEANALTFNFERCNGVIFSDFLHHISYVNQDKLLQKISYKVKKGGVVVIKEIDRSSRLRQFLSRIWDFLLYPQDTIYYRSRTEWSNVMKKLGFAVTIHDEVLWFPGSTTVLVCKKH